MSREDWRKQGFAYGEVDKEAVYLTPTKKTSIRIPPPPPFKNHGNEVISVSELARFQQQTAEDGGAYIHETAATQLVVEDGQVVGVRTGDKGRDKEGEPKGNFEPGTDIKAKATVLAEGCWGHLTGPAIREFDLGDDREPQTWELGVKEVWKVAKPLDRLIHTIGPWPVSTSAKYGQVGGTWIYPMKDEETGDDLVSIGFVIDLEYADATTSAHDLLQTFKLHPLVKKILEGSGSGCVCTRSPTAPSSRPCRGCGPTSSARCRRSWTPRPAGASTWSSGCGAGWPRCPRRSVTRRAAPACWTSCRPRRSGPYWTGSPR